MVTRPHRAIGSLALFGVLLVAAIVIGIVMATRTFRDRELANNERELKNTALILAEQTDRTIQSLDLVLTSVIERMQSLGISSAEDFARQMSGQDVQSLLKDKISGLPHIDAVSLFDVDGKMINLSRFWPVPNLSNADRKYFLAFKSDPKLNSLISEPVINRATGTWTMFLVRRLTDPSGRFLGVINGAMELAFYEKLFGAVVLNEHSSISLQHSDGTLLARYPRIETAIGAVFMGANNALGEHNSGTARLIGKMDGRDRLLAAHRLPHYPLVIAVTTDADAALASWRDQRNLLIGGGAFSVLAITIVFLLIVRQLSRGHRWSKQRLALEKLRLDTAINNMSQGLLLFDTSERMVVCNQRYIQMYGLSPDVVKPGCTFRDLILHRKESGTFNGDIDEYHSSLMRDLAQGKASEQIIEPPDGRSIRVVNQPLANGGWVATHEDITERKRSDERIAHLAHYDALTDLPNRVLFREKLEQSLKWL